MGWLDIIKIEDIASERIRLIAEVCGLSDAIVLIKKLPGIDIYVPSSGHKKLILKYIKDHYNGKNISMLSVRLGMQRSAIEKLVKDGIERIYTKDILSNNFMMLVADRCGYDVAIRLIQHFPGQRILIPKDIFSAFKRKYIIKNFNGENIIELALFLECSENFVRKTIAEMYTSRHKQLSLFDAV